MTSERWSLPRHWCWATIGDIGKVVGGGTPSTRDPANFSDDQGIPWITPADLSGYSDPYISHGRRFLSQKGLEKSGAVILPPGAVLFSSRAPIGYCVIAKNPLATNQGFKSLVPEHDISAEFLRYYLKYSKGYAESLASGTTFLELSGAKFDRLMVPIAPKAEQDLIVQKLDQIFESIFQSRARVSEIPQLARHYIQILLKKAFNGDLVSNIERGASASGWSFEEVLAIPVQNGLSIRGSDSPPGIRALKLSALRGPRVNLSDVRYLPITREKAKRFFLQEGDILVSRGNGTRTLVGISSIVEGIRRPTIFPDTAFRLRVDQAKILPDWLAYIWNAPQMRQKLEAAAKTTAGIWKINQKDLKSLLLPKVSLSDQRLTADRLKRAMLRVDALLQKVAAIQMSLSRLEDGSFAKAFKGELIPTNPSGGSGYDIVARIQTRRRVGEKLQSPRRLPRRPMSTVQAEKVMAKTRFDKDVKNRPYLSAYLKQQSKGLSPLDLFQASNLSAIDFYKQLSWEIDAGFIQDKGNFSGRSNAAGSRFYRWLSKLGRF